MTKRILDHRLYFVLALILLTQGCMQIRPAVLPTESAAAEVQVEASITPTLKVETPFPTATAIIPTETSMPKVTVSAVKGNLFIRRGPGVAYNPISVLSSGTSAEVIAHDMLSKWAQVIIPNSDRTGWVSLLTDYSQVNGDLSSLPGFTFTDWPVPAYLINCMEHEMYIMPGRIILPSILASPDNQIWLYPGSYTIYDYALPDQPQVQSLDIREGLTDYIVYDGLGKHSKCK